MDFSKIYLIFILTSTSFPLISCFPVPAEVRLDNSVVIFLRKLIENVVQQLRVGVPFLGLPPLDPLEMGNMSVNELPFGFIGIVGSIYELQTIGLSNIEANNIVFKMLPPSLQIDLGLPLIQLNGQYNLTGQITSGIGFSGAGPFHFTVKPLNLSVSADFKLASGSVALSNFSFSLKAKSVTIQFDKLLGGGFLASIVNAYLSSVLKQFVDGELAKLSSSVTQKILELLGDSQETFVFTNEFTRALSDPSRFYYYLLRQDIVSRLMMYKPL